MAMKAHNFIMIRSDNGKGKVYSESLIVLFNSFDKSDVNKSERLWLNEQLNLKHAVASYFWTVNNFVYNTKFACKCLQSLP